MHGFPTIATPVQPELPEQAARRIIDYNLRTAGWAVQSADDVDVSASLGVAVAELPIGGGLADSKALFTASEREFVEQRDAQIIVSAASIWEILLTQVEGLRFLTRDRLLVDHPFAITIP